MPVSTGHRDGVCRCVVRQEQPEQLRSLYAVHVCYSPLWLHLFFKPEVFRPIFIPAVRIVRVLVVGVEVFDNVESAFVDIEMDVPLLETRCYQFPHLCFGIQAFNLFPNGIPKSPNSFRGTGSNRMFICLTSCSFCAK